MAASTAGTPDKGKVDPSRVYDIKPPPDDVFEYFATKIVDCDLYYREYKECKKLGMRADQYYVYGKLVDCDHMNSIYNACLDSKKGGQAGKEYIIHYEKARSKFRIENAQMNDVWEYRTEPYEQWHKDINQVDVEDFSKANNDKDYTSTSGGKKSVDGENQTVSTTTSSPTLYYVKNFFGFTTKKNPDVVNSDINNSANVNHSSSASDSNVVNKSTESVGDSSKSGDLSKTQTGDNLSVPKAQVDNTYVSSPTNKPSSCVIS